MAEIVLVTEPEFIKGQSVFTASEFDVRSAPSDEIALSEEVRRSGTRAVILGVERYTGLLYEALGETGKESGAILARFGVGHDGVDKAKAHEYRITVANTPGALDASVAEHAIWLMGTLARNVSALDASMRRNEFVPREGVELAGKTLVVLGFGPIGRRVAKIAHHGLAMNVLAVDILPREKLETTLGASFGQIAAEYGLTDYVSRADDVLGKADIISLHLPAVEATRHFINADRLAKVKPGAFLVNTARGSLVDESALYDALVSSGRLAAAGLDVFEQEPYRPVDVEKDLRTLTNVVLTPHVGSNTYQSNIRMATMCLTTITLLSKA